MDAAPEQSLAAYCRLLYWDSMCHIARTQRWIALRDFSAQHIDDGYETDDYEEGAYIEGYDSDVTVVPEYAGASAGREKCDGYE